MVCDAFSIPVAIVCYVISVCMLFFQSFETLAQPMFQKMIFYKSIHCLLSLIKRKHALPCIWNCIQPVKMPVSLPKKKFTPAGVSGYKKCPLLSISPLMRLTLQTNIPVYEV